jgi:type I restriction enzyme M protein
MLKDGGRLAFVIPDGLLNNQGDLSNCPAVRRLLARSGVIEASTSMIDKTPARPPPIPVNWDR